MKERGDHQVQMSLGESVSCKNCGVCADLEGDERAQGMEAIPPPEWDSGVGLEENEQSVASG